MTDDRPAATEPATPSVAGGWTEIAVVLAVVLLPAVQTAYAVRAWPATFPHSPPVAYYETAMLATVVGWIGLVLLMVRRSGLPARRFGLGPPDWGVDICVGCLVMVGGYQIATVVDGLCAGSRWDDTAPMGFLTPLSRSRWWEYGLTLIGISVAALAEELVYRAYLLTRLELLTGSVASAWLASSVVFGGAHLYQGPSGVLGATLIGLLLGAIFCWHRRVWGVTLAHAGCNLLLILLPDFQAL